MQASHRTRPVFDDPNLVGYAGLVPVLLLARAAGLYRLAGQHLQVASANAPTKSAAVVAGMVAGADSIDGMDRLRHGGMRRLFAGIVAPSTIGIYLRAFTAGQIAQLDAVATRFLVNLIGLVGGLLPSSGATGSSTGSRGSRGKKQKSVVEGLVFCDVDDTIRQVYGYAKQGAAYGYSKVKGLNAQVATLSTPVSLPVIAAAKLRRGNVSSCAGSPRLLARALNTARAAGVTCRVLVRADSAYFTAKFIATAVRHGAWFSVTARMNPKVKAAIAGIDPDAWTPIRYPQAIWEDDQTVPGGGYWVSDAEVAEVVITVFTSKHEQEPVTCRLVVRRVRRQQRLASDGTAQGELFAAHRHHAFVTNSGLGMVEADQTHRDHAVVEQVIAELKAGALAHLPSGVRTANAAWLAHAVIAFNLARAAAVLAGPRHARTRWATLRAQLIAVPGRVANRARRLTLHLPRGWAWATGYDNLHDQSLALLTGTMAGTGPPRPVAA